MKLVAFSVTNFRSIVEAYKLSLGNYTVLVGPNNEGKSNIVKALALSLSQLTSQRPMRHRIRTRTRLYQPSLWSEYDWDRDYPVSLQGTHPEGKSVFTLEFQLDDDDFQSFWTQVGVKLTTNLKCRLRFGREDIRLEILMKGRGKKTLNSKAKEVTAFIRRHVSAQYISALRPSEMALEIVNGLIEGELFSLEDDEEYRKTIKRLKDLQRPTLDKIAKKVKATVSDFVPGVRDIQITNELLSRAFRTSFNIMVDDGANTELASKGDGIISLVTMSLMKHVSEESLGGKSLILSIEEPESHLHPEAIHGLRRVLKDIAREQQVIVTTHSPILVERERISQNIIVRRGRAEKAKGIEQIRQTLGIRMADNLMGAYVVLLVEGDDDRDMLTMWLSAFSPKLQSALSRRILIVDHLAGATNLSYKASFYRQNVCNIHAFLDNDDVGRKAVEDALDHTVLDPSDYNLASCQGMENSEIEDLLKLEIYAPAVKKEYGVELRLPKFRHSMAKWSDRVGDAFQLSGKLWNKRVKKGVKRVVSRECVEFGPDCLNDPRRGPIDTLVTSLESKLAARGAQRGM